MAVPDTLDLAVVRPMRVDDVETAERISAEAFLAVDVATARPGDPSPQRRSASSAASWVRRTSGFLATDPDGCWVAETADGLVGFATSLRRENTWILATFAVRPGLQGRGVGARVLGAALAHGRGCLRGMLASSDDPRAMRRYVRAGFTLHPQFLLTGRPDRSAIPVTTGERVREGSPADVDLLDSLDRRCRGATRRPDHAFLLGHLRLLVCETGTGEGYAFVRPDGDVVLLAASDRRTAEHLLWTALADAPGETMLAHVTSANHWAVEVGVTAGLAVRQRGHLALRGMRPPTFYLHHGALL